MSFDFDKYKEVWKKEDKFSEDLLSENDIWDFIQTESQGAQRIYRNGVVFDLVLKSLLLLCFASLFFLYKDLSVGSLNLVLLVVTVLGLTYQWKTYHRIPQGFAEGLTTTGIVHLLLDFHQKYYRWSILVSALSAPLFFMAGSMFYLYFKYRPMPKFQWDDLIVMVIGIFLSYGLSAFSQWWQANQLVEEWEMCQGELENDAFTEQHVRTIRKKRSRILMLFGMLLLAGLVILLSLIFILAP